MPTQNDDPAIPRSITSVWPALVPLAVAVVALVTAWGYPPVAARFPVMVGIAMIVLGALDVWGRSGLPGAGVIDTFGGTGFARREMNYDPALGDQAAALGWIALCFVLMAAAGILAASPVFAAAYVRFRGRRSWAVAAIVGLAVLAFQFIVFEWALDYTLYRGVFVTRGGISSW